MSHAFRRAKDRRKRSSLQSFWSSGIVDLDLCRGRLRVGESRAAEASELSLQLGVRLGAEMEDGHGKGLRC
ncbi:unnamed protein product [Sphagnum jensenii]|uniref:Uncharacterized protein n=1 Tax=Sphagnum jensenii TaxID=128206 RepID=A0ABP1BMX4_9BRYO